ncbi:outer membrane protein [Bradyrhizobium sp. McL0616]|uniref:outer membrane protein n=1 Tax=Bradyrhizobium sp. McL0616 TaxID=3415674 RepID=UPI003CFB31A7
MQTWVPAAIAAIVITGSVNAADLAPVYKAPPAAPIAYSWSGFYLGGSVGVMWNDTRADPVSFTTTGVDFSGRQAVGQFPRFDVGDTAFTGGVQVGYNFQFGSNWVAGIEADINSSGLKKTDTRVFPATPFIGGGIIDANTESATQKLGWLGTLRGRLGFTTLNNRLLAFATAGLAYGKVDDSIYTIGVPNGAGPFSDQRQLGGGSHRMDGGRRPRVRICQQLEGQGRIPLLRSWCAKPHSGLRPGSRRCEQYDHVQISQ